MIRRVHLLVVAVRPAVIVLLALFAGVGTSVATRHPGTLVTGRVLVVVMALLVVTANTNDISDEAIDRVNLAGDRRRPLVAGTGTTTELLVIAVTAGALAVSRSFWTVGGLMVVAITARTAAWCAMCSALLVLTWTLFAGLDRCTSRRTEAWLISATAIVGRGTVLLVWIHRATTNAGWTDTRAALVGGVVTLVTAAQALAMVAYGPRLTLTVPSEWAAGIPPGPVPTTTAQVRREPALSATGGVGMHDGAQQS